MKEIKEKQHFQRPKEPDPFRRLPRPVTGARSATESVFIEPAGEAYDSPAAYAEERTEQIARSVSEETAKGTKSASKGIKKGIRELQRQRMAERASEDAQENVRSGSEDPEPVSTGHAPYSSYDSVRTTKEPSEEKACSQRGSAESPHSSIPARSDHGQTQAKPEAQGARASGPARLKTGAVSVKKAESAPKYAVRSIKTANRTVRTAKKTVRASEKAAKKAERAYKAVKETAQRAAQASARAAKLAAKALEEAIKAIVAAARELIALIASGGWVADVILLAVSFAAALLLSCFGLFWSNDASKGNPMTEIISRVDSAYQKEIEDGIERLASSVEHDEIEIVYRGGDGDGETASVCNWNDALAVFAVLHTTGEDPRALLEPTEQTERLLREVFFSMNRVTLTYELVEKVPEDAPVPTPDENGETPPPDTVTVLIVTVHQDSMTYKEAAVSYGFDSTQTELVEEMMSPEWFSYYAALIGVDVYGGADYTEIISHLPVSGKGALVVKAALTRLGCPYVWGAKGSTKFDCSGLAYWAIHEVDPSLGDRMYTNAAGQAKYCYDRGLTVGRSELQPGDLVFWVNKKCEGCHRWKEVHHVGIYAGNGKVIEAASGKGRVLLRDLWESANYPILMFGRPYQ